MHKWTIDNSHKLLHVHTRNITEDIAKLQGANRKLLNADRNDSQSR